MKKFNKKLERSNSFERKTIFIFRILEEKKKETFRNEEESKGQANSLMK